MPGGWHAPQHPPPSITADHIQLRTIYDGQFPSTSPSHPAFAGATQWLTELFSEQTIDCLGRHTTCTFPPVEFCLNSLYATQGQAVGWSPDVIHFTALLQ